MAGFYAAVDNWLRSYIELPEYRGFHKVEQFAKRDDAG